VASAALQVSKPCPGSPCAAAAATAMSQGFEALQAASSAASATEQAAAKLQADPVVESGEELAACAQETAQLATAAASAAVAAALAASEAHKAAVDLESERTSKEKEDGGEKKKEDEEEKETEEKEKDKEKEKEKEKDESSSPSGKDPKAKKNKEVWQRVNNWKLAVRLNSEILSQQTKMKEMLQSNRYLIPEVTTQQKTDAFVLVEEYCVEAQQWLSKRITPSMDEAAATELLNAFVEASPIAQVVASDPELAISTQVGCRVLKLAALLDNAALIAMLEKHVISVLEPTGVEALSTWGKNLTKYVRGLI